MLDTKGRKIIKWLYDANNHNMNNDKKLYFSPNLFDHLILAHPLIPQRRALSNRPSQFFKFMVKNSQIFTGLHRSVESVRRKQLINIIKNILNGQVFYFGFYATSVSGSGKRNPAALKDYDKNLDVLDFNEFIRQGKQGDFQNLVAFLDAGEKIKDTSLRAAFTNKVLLSLKQIFDDLFQHPEIFKKDGENNPRIALDILAGDYKGKWKSTTAKRRYYSEYYDLGIMLKKKFGELYGDDFVNIKKPASSNIFSAKYKGDEAENYLKNEIALFLKKTEKYNTYKIETSQGKNNLQPDVIVKDQNDGQVLSIEVKRSTGRFTDFGQGRIFFKNGQWQPNFTNFSLLKSFELISKEEGKKIPNSTLLNYLPLPDNDMVFPTGPTLFKDEAFDFVSYFKLIENKIAVDISVCVGESQNINDYYARANRFLFIKQNNSIYRLHEKDPLKQIPLLKDKIKNPYVVFRIKYHGKKFLKKTKVEKSIYSYTISQRCEDIEDGMNLEEALQLIFPNDT